MTDRDSQDRRLWHVQVSAREPRLDGHGRDVLADVRQIGLEHVEAIRASRVYLFGGRLSEQDIRLIASELLADRVAEVWDCGPGLSQREDAGCHAFTAQPGKHAGPEHGSRSRGTPSEHGSESRGTPQRKVAQPAIEVHPLPGVMNPVAISTLDAARRLLKARTGADGVVDEVHTARRYEVVGARDAAELEQIASKVLANDCIETWYLSGFGRNDKIPEAFPTPPTMPFRLRHVAIHSLGDAELARLSREAHLFLSIEEMGTIRDHFAKLGRDPTDLELETLAQTWSEHCVHKTLKSTIEYDGAAFGMPGRTRARFENLLKATIAAATTTLDRDWCLSVFLDNAGVIAFDEEYALAFKVETHNHPSAIEPYGGAATGIGGCIRDVMGCGLGAKPIASTDVFCVAPPTYDAARLPRDVLHPRRILKGVVGGVRDYGNRMGIPTVNGAIYFDDRYLANPLVFCGCVGLIPRDRIAKQPHTGDRIVVAGGRTGRDGIHGATFSSAELTDTHAGEFSHAVQIGNAVEEKKVLDAQLLARDHAEGCLYSAVTDCGAGGLSSAVGEMGEHLGAVVDLDDVPLKYAGLRYDEIWISEAQERMVFAVPPEKLDAFLAVFAAEDVEATVIGTFTDDQMLIVRYQGHVVGELDMAFLHNGLPRTVRTARWERDGVQTMPADGTAESSGNARLLKELSALNTASKEWVIRQYDHEVQGRSVIKPLVGPAHGPSDAAVLRPRYDRDRGIAIGCGLCPELYDVDPYLMAVAAVDEALRNVICVGGDPQRTAILDNFCWPKADTEESLGALVRACKGAADAAVAYGLPFISGKDSLNNEYTMSEQEAARVGLPSRLAIPGTLLISALSIVEDANCCVTMDLKQPGDVLVLASAPADRVGLEKAMAMHARVADLVRGGYVRAAHDISDGGLAVAVAEMCIASGLGATVATPNDDFAESLFAPLLTSYVLEMTEEAAKEAGLPLIGRVTEEPRLTIDGDGIEPINLAVADLASAWKSPLARGGGQ